MKPVKWDKAKWFSSEKVTFRIPCVMMTLKRNDIIIAYDKVYNQIYNPDNMTEFSDTFLETISDKRRELDNLDGEKFYDY